MTICYVLGNSLYINLTNRCSNACTFCVRTNENWPGGEAGLWIDREPTTEEIICDIKKFGPDKYDEVVFCGYGEPLVKIDECIAACRFIKENYGSKIRINTNGHANLIHKKDVAPLFEGLVDVMSISLNEMNAKLYNELCLSEYGEAGFTGMIGFTEQCLKHVPRVIMTVIDIIPPDHIDQCEKIAERLGADFRVRKMIN